MPRLTIQFFERSSTPSVLVDGDFGGPMVREFIANELRTRSSCEYFLNVFEELPPGVTYDHGFGNAIAVYVENDIAYLEHVIADEPEYKLPLPLLMSIARTWAHALVTKPHEFESQHYEIP
jgi:hypothetical protein